MADPFTMIGIAATAGGSILQAQGNMQAGQAQAGMYQYQAGLAQYNSQIAKQNADYALHVGETQAMQSGLKYKAEIGTTIARQGASGIAVGQGSAADVVNSEKMLSRIDSAIIRNNAARKAYGYEVEATSDTAQSKLYSYAADNSARAGEIAAMGSILGGVSSVASKWSQAQSSGAANMAAAFAG